MHRHPPANRHLQLVSADAETARPQPDLAALRRAQRLRRLADRIDRALVAPLCRYGKTSWRGPRAELGIRILDHNVTQLRRAAQELRVHATRIELDATAA